MKENNDSRQPNTLNVTVSHAVKIWWLVACLCFVVHWLKKSMLIMYTPNIKDNRVFLYIFLNAIINKSVFRGSTRQAHLLLLKFKGILYRIVGYCFKRKCSLAKFKLKANTRFNIIWQFASLYLCFLGTLSIGFLLLTVTTF